MLRVEVFYHELSMSLRPPAEYEKGPQSQNMSSPRFVIPAQAGIQVISPSK